MNTTKLQEFIIRNPTNWRELLSSPPYCLKIREKDELILFMYSLIDSDLSDPIVQESRGIILEKDTWDIVCYPFNKFFNYGEPNAAKIDWSSATITQKEDGSIIKVYFYKKWRVATNGCIDAKDAKIDSIYYANFRELFDMAATESNLDYDKLDPHYTYIFELCSPFNQVVCPQIKTKLYHIGTRSNTTLQEEEIDIGIEKPKSYSLATLNDCLACVKNFGIDMEGLVVKDANYNRIKVKGEVYVHAHYLAQKTDLRQLISIYLDGEQHEFITYFPHLSSSFSIINSTYKDIIREIYYKAIQVNRLKKNGISAKDFAIKYAIKESPFFKSLMFSIFNDTIKTVQNGTISLENAECICRNIDKRRLIEVVYNRIRKGE